MISVYIDTTSRDSKTVQLKKDNLMLSELKGDLDVVAVLADMLKQHKLSVKDIDSFNVNPGPGSFTGIKMGITVVNVLNWITGKKKISELTQPEYGGEPNIQGKN